MFSHKATVNKFLFALFIFFFIVQMQLNAQVTIEWENAFGGDGPDIGFSVLQTNDGGYTVLGSSNSTQNTGEVTCENAGLWLLKLNSNGALEWQQCIGTAIGIHGSHQPTSDGGYIISAPTVSENNQATGNHGGTDFWLVKLNSSGNTQWQKCLGGTLEDFPYDAHQTTDGGYIIVGNTNSNDGDVSGLHGVFISDVWIVKVDSVGNIQWQKCLGGSSYDYANSVSQTTDGGYAVVGYTKSNDGDVSGNHGFYDVWVVKLDELGNIKWQICLGGTEAEYGYTIKQTTDNSLILCGATGSQNGDVGSSNGTNEAWIIKLNSEGSLLWEKCAGGLEWDAVYSVVQTIDGGYALAGSTEGDIDGFKGYEDFLIMQLDGSGNIQWQNALGGTAYDEAEAIIQTSDYGYLLVGNTKSNDGDVTGNESNLDIYYPQYYYFDIWVVKIKSSMDLVNNLLYEGERLNVSPNPALEKINISFKSPDNFNGDLQLSIYDVLGKLVLLQKKSVQSFLDETLNISCLASGIYTLELRGEALSCKTMFVKQ